MKNRPHWVIFVTTVTVVVVVVLASAARAQDVTFKGHAIGETATDFFKKATLDTPAHPSTLDFCNTQLNTPGVQKFYEPALDEINHPRRHKRESEDDMRKRISADAQSLLDMTACLQVTSAIQRKDAVVNSDFASELGSGTGHGIGYKGEATFHDGKLVCLKFSSGQDFDAVVGDMSKRLRQAPISKGYTTMQNGYGATFEYPKADWDIGNIHSHAELIDFEFSDLKDQHLPPIKLVEIVVGNGQWLQAEAARKEAARPNSLD